MCPFELLRTGVQLAGTKLLIAELLRGLCLRERYDGSSDRVRLAMHCERSMRKQLLRSSDERQFCLSPCFLLPSTSGSVCGVQHMCD